MFLISNKFEQLEFKLEKKYWDVETCRKSQKNYVCFKGDTTTQLLHKKFEPYLRAGIKKNEFD